LADFKVQSANRWQEEEKGGGAATDEDVLLMSVFTLNGAMFSPSGRPRPSKESCVAVFESESKGTL